MGPNANMLSVLFTNLNVPYLSIQSSKWEMSELFFHQATDISLFHLNRGKFWGTKNSLQTVFRSYYGPDWSWMKNITFSFVTIPELLGGVCFWCLHPKVILIMENRYMCICKHFVTPSDAHLLFMHHSRYNRY